MAVIGLAGRSASSDGGNHPAAFLSEEVREVPWLEPLAESGPLELVPGEVTAWIVALPDAIDVRQLNPVCTPMIEG